jgi:integration host factor subunit alpha
MGRISRGFGQMSSIDTLTRAEIAEAMNRKIGLSRSESLTLVESILGHMSDALAKGQNLKVSGFGTFLLRDKAERVGRNPKTGVEVPITSRRVLTFRASQMLKDRVSGK